MWTKITLKQLVGEKTNMKEAIKILISKKFWKDFKEYYSAKEISKRINTFTEKLKKK